MANIRTSNKDCRKYVDVRAPFKGNNIFGRWRTTTAVKREQVKLYIVSSFEVYYPIYVYDSQADRWFEAIDFNYRVETIKHKELSRPTDVEITQVDHQKLQYIYIHGFVQFISRKLEGDPTIAYVNQFPHITHSITRIIP